MSSTWTVEKDWEHAGLRCVAGAGSQLCHRCGYVGVPKPHPLHGVGYSEESEALRAAATATEHNYSPTPELIFNVHGGITYSGGDDYPAESDGLWWFGFDCAHLGDMPDPTLKSASTSSYCFNITYDGTIRTLDYVVAECESLARQLAAIKKENPCETNDSTAAPGRSVNL